MVGLRIIIHQLTGKVISEVEIGLTKCNMKETSNTHLKRKKSSSTYAIFEISEYSCTQYVFN